MKAINILLGFVFLSIMACKKDSSSNTQTTTSTFEAYSTAFVNNGTFPKLYTCDSTGISPTVSWKNAPVGTNAYAITMHTIPPTGDKHVYIVLYNLPANLSSIAQGVSNTGVFGINTVNGKMSYTPPCSQGPGAKIYIITVYALSKQPVISVAPSAVSMDVLLSAMSGITLGTSTITVSYTR
ncbi:MAG: YbhB/YbcL family Raf kinase inhibitor-like protein [Pedobacter sp.]|nr:YbhB/YbcL family Raf kinase inhibitor-like protein [Pedobacter sp.]